MTDILDDTGGQRSRGPAPEAESEPAAPAEERIAKVIARAGIASRRDAEALIAAGRVTVNGALLTSPALNVGPEDRITVDGELLPSRERTRLWLFHKPRGLVTTFKDPEGRPTVFDALPEDMPRVVAIGRLDMNTEGLLLLTNDGGLAKVIAHPETGWTRRYRVRAYGEIEQGTLDRLRDGITIDGMEYGAIEAKLDRQQGDNSWITLALREGKNREVKRILEHLGLQVNRLLRLSFGPFQLGDLEPGLVEEVRTRVLKDQLGAALATEAGVDFESPVRSPIEPFGAPARPARPGRVPEPRRASEAAERERSRGRDDRSGGPGSFTRGGDQPRFRPPGDRPRPSGDRPRPTGGERSGPPAAGRPRVGDRGERRPTEVWRPDREEEGGRPKRRDRRDDPKAERDATAARPRQRAAPIERDGRRVMVERVLPVVGDEAPSRARGRDEGPDPRRPARPDRAGPSRESRDGARPGRPPREGARPERAWQDRPPRDFERPRGDRAERPAGPGRPPASRGEERPRSGFGRPGGGAGRAAPGPGRGGPPGRPFGGDKGRPFGGDKGRPFGGDKGRPFGGDKGRPFGGDKGRSFGGDKGRLPGRPTAGKPAFGAKRPPRSGPPRSGPPGRGPRPG